MQKMKTLLFIIFLAFAHTGYGQVDTSYNTSCKNVSYYKISMGDSTLSNGVWLREYIGVGIRKERVSGSIPKYKCIGGNISIIKKYWIIKIKKRIKCNQ